MYFKGVLLANLYDDPYVRTRGDIDVYVYNESFSLARQLLLDVEFKIEDADCMHHSEFVRNDFMFELHFGLVPVFVLVH